MLNVSEDVKYVPLAMTRVIFERLNALLTYLRVNLPMDSLIYGSELLYEHGFQESTVSGRARNITQQRAVMNSDDNDSRIIYT